MLPSKLAFLDIETTGASLNSDRVIEVGILRVENNTLVKTFNSLVDPGVYIPKEITRLTGITEELIKGAPSFSQIKEEILELMEGCTIVAHNASFDYGFIKNELKRFNTNFSAKRICTVKLSRALFPEFPKHDLSSIITRFNFDCPARHRAFDDAKVLWDFFQKVTKDFPEDILIKAIDSNLKKPNIPVNVPAKVMDALPEEHGVYIFYDESHMPLYIGKSNNLKKRVLSHFSASLYSTTEMKLLQQTTNIETLTTTGELEALLTESDLIKKMQPLYNRRLRQSREITVLKISQTKSGYETLEIDVASSITQDDLDSVVTVFKNKKQAQEYLRKLSKEHSLCEKLLGLEKTDRACFGYHLGSCKGGCIGKEIHIKYNMRLRMAISSKKLKPWPFEGPVLIKQKHHTGEKEAGFLIDKWCFMGKITISDDNTEEFQGHPSFDIDTYRILHRFLSDSKNLKQVKKLSKNEFTSLVSQSFN